MNENRLQEAKVSRATVIITVMLMTILVAGIVVLPYFTEPAPGTEMARQKQESTAEQGARGAPAPAPPSTDPVQPE